MLIHPHIILVSLWIAFGVLHSVLAGAWFKRRMQQLLQRNFKYYPLAYSIFAAVTMTGILLYQYHIPGKLLFTTPLWLIVPAGIGTSAGVIIMGMMIWKYFYYLSGISVFFTKEPPAVLQLGGLHRYVRHPLYTGTLLFIWSLFLLFPYTKHLLACIIITAYTLYGVQLEEKKLVAQYGEAYIKYRKRTPMLIPGLRRDK
jgi:protein-S-isoprenylcysteine O-methyltransferase Ste14